MREQQVDIDINISAFANAQAYFDTKKAHAVKKQKAEAAIGVVRNDTRTRLRA